MSELGDEAVRLARAGFAVFPLVPRGKEPATKHGLHAWTDSPDDVAEIWRRNPEYNIGIALGEPSGGVFVIDIDVHDGSDGIEFLEEWEREHGKLPQTVSVVTGTGGIHMYYRSNVPVRCSVNRDAGIDVRGDGGYVVAPPSVHPNGSPYFYDLSRDDVEIAWADERVREFLACVQGRLEEDRRKFELPERIGTGERNETLFKYACSLQSKGRPDDEIRDAVFGANFSRCDKPLTTSEVNKLLHSVSNFEKGKSRDVEKSTEKPDDQFETVEPGMGLDLDKRKKPLLTSYNFSKILELDPALSGRFWYDEMSYCRKVVLPLPWDAGGEGTVRQLTEADYSGMDIYMSHRYRMSKRQAMADAVVGVCMGASRNPLQELISAVEWDGIVRLPGLLYELAGSAMDDYEYAVSELIGHALVARAFRPGCKLDSMFVLCGPQGCGKSSAIRSLALCAEWYCDSVGTFDGDDAVEKIRGKHVVEVSELSAFKRSKDIETIKGFITRRSDTIRPKYARETEDRPRTCVLFGSTNAGGYISDVTGARRFVNIECGINPVRHDTVRGGAELDHYIRQVYAEAKAWLDDGSVRHDLVLPEAADAVAAAFAESHSEVDPREGVIEEYLISVLERSDRPDKCVCVREVMEKALSVGPDQWNKKLSNEVAEIVRCRCGWSACGQKRFPGYGKQLAFAPQATAAE